MNKIVPKKLIIYYRNPYGEIEDKEIEFKHKDALLKTINQDKFIELQGEIININRILKIDTYKSKYKRF